MSAWVVEDVGPWSEIKLEIIRDYAAAYSRILSAQGIFEHIYIDGFCGAGVHISRATGGYIPGSPLNALNVKPPFREYHLIDIEGDKLDTLGLLVGDRPNVYLYKANCNRVLLERILPTVIYEQYRRALCLLDPYGLHLDWRVIELAGRLRTVEIFLNFPIMHMNRGVLRRNPEKAVPSDVERMTTFWGDGSWRQIAYSKVPGLFYEEEYKKNNRAIVDAFVKRLKLSAGFQYVAKPFPMRNSKGAVVYYLLFAAQRPVAANIVKDIFMKYRFWRPARS